jgi:hypothetical protein
MAKSHYLRLASSFLNRRLNSVGVCFSCQYLMQTILSETDAIAAQEGWYIYIYFVSGTMCTAKGADLRPGDPSGSGTFAWQAGLGG